MYVGVGMNIAYFPKSCPVKMREKKGKKTNKLKCDILVKTIKWYFPVASFSPRHLFYATSSLQI